MINKIPYYLGIFFSIVTISSCSDYQKVLKDEDVKAKYEMAQLLFDQEDYKRASRLYEQILPRYRGKPQGERVTYFYAMTLLKTKNYFLASYQFETFQKAFPKSDKVSEALYNEAYCYFIESPVFSLDQSSTEQALDKLQDFINRYPDSELMPEANNMAQKLQYKLEKKAFEIAKQYNTIRDYKAAIVSLNSFISNYPGTPFREDALFYQFESSYYLGINSVQHKKYERLKDAQKIYDKFVRYYPESKFGKKSSKMMQTIDEEITKFVPTKKS